MYIDVSDLLKSVTEEVLIQLTDDESTGAVVDEVAENAITDASVQIDSYIGAVVALPLATTPDIIKNICADIAIYNLYSRLFDPVPETRVERMKMAITMLGQMAKGDLTFGVQPIPEEPTSLKPALVFTRTQQYTSTTLGKY